jgi:hypothetical protein
MTTLKIKVTKDILEKSKYCDQAASKAKYNCAVSLAIRDIFPESYVMQNYINPMVGCHVISLPEEARDFIGKFDISSPEERMLMPELEFEISIQDSTIEKINIDELRPLLQNHPTLQLIDAI